MSGPLVLMIDDDQALREIVGELLKRYHFNVVCAECSAEGIELATLHPPDVILCDVILPDKSGFETAEALRSHPVTKDVPVIFMTGYAYMRDMIKDNVTRVLLKPVTGDVLVNTICDLLREKKSSTKAIAA